VRIITHVVCNEVFTVFFTMPKKDRDTIKNILGLKADEQIEDKIMISDDAKQFWGVAVYHALCWIHEIRQGS